MSKLFPSKSQFKKWSMPTKIGYIGSFLTILTFVLSVGIWLYNKTIEAYETKQEDINYWFASGLWNINNGNTKEAKSYFRKILDTKDVDSYTKEQCAIWNLSLMNFGEDVLSKEDIDYCFNFFSVESDSINATKLILYRILPLIQKDSSNKAISLYNQIEGYTHRYSKQLRLYSQINYSADSILNFLLINKYDFSSKYNERIFDNLIFATIANEKEKEELTLLAVAVSYRNDPLEFEDMYFCVYDPFLNIRYNRLDYRKAFQQTTDSVLKTINANFKVQYYNELSNYANSIGATYYVSQLIKGDDINNIIHKNKQPHELRSNILFASIKHSNEYFFLYNIYASVDTVQLNMDIEKILKRDSIIDRDKYKYMLAMNNIRGEIIRVSNGRIVSQISIIDSLINYKGGLATLDIIPNIEYFVQNDEFYLVVRRGTVLSLEIYKIGLDGSCTLIPFSSNKFYDNYRNFCFFYNEDRKELNVEFEKENWTQANAISKVRGVITAEVRDSIYITNINFKNPAAELFIKRIEENIKFQAFIINNVKLNGREIVDVEFLDCIKNNHKLNYVKTSCDNMYEYVLSELMPDISILQIRFTLDEFSEDKKREYIILVKRTSVDEIEVLDIYKIINSKKLKSITQSIQP